MLPSMWAKFQGAGMVLLWQPAPLTNLAWVWFHPGAIRAFSPFSFFFFFVFSSFTCSTMASPMCIVIYLLLFIWKKQTDIWTQIHCLTFGVFFLKWINITQLCTCFASYKWTCSLELKMLVSSCTGYPEFPGWSCWHLLIQFSVH